MSDGTTNGPLLIEDTVPPLFRGVDFTHTLQTLEELLDLDDLAAAIAIITALLQVAAEWDRQHPDTPNAVYCAALLETDVFTRSPEQLPKFFEHEHVRQALVHTTRLRFIWQHRLESIMAKKPDQHHVPHAVIALLRPAVFDVIELERRFIGELPVQ